MSIKRFLLIGLFLMRAATAGDDPELKRLYEEKNYKQLLDRFKKITEGRATNAGYSLSEIASAKYNIGVMYYQICPSGASIATGSRMSHSNERLSTMPSRLHPQKEPLL